MKKRILLTRAKEDIKCLREILACKNYICIECSLIDCVNIPFNAAIIDNFTDIIVTSKRAATLLPTVHISKNAWLVGRASANILSKKGYNIKYVASSASELREHLPSIDLHRMIYFASNVVSIKMPLPIQTVEIYNIIYKEKLSVDEILLLKESVEYILLYSENCAKIFMNLIIKNNLLKYLKNAVVITISSKVEKVIKDYFEKTIACVNSYSMLEQLEDYDRRR